MVSSCNQIKRDSWSMNLCVETAPSALTALWEGLGLGTSAGERAAPGWHGLIGGLAKVLLQRGQATNRLSVS